MADTGLEAARALFDRGRYDDCLTVSLHIHFEEDVPTFLNGVVSLAETAWDESKL